MIYLCSSTHKWSKFSKKMWNFYSPPLLPVRAVKSSVWQEVKAEEDEEGGKGES